MKQVIITTLGCKVNQCESSAIGTQLAAAGYETVKNGASVELIVINTCTVTGKAAMQSRQAIRQAMRQYPDAKIVVTGCYAQTAPEEIQAIQGIDLIVGHADKMRIGELISHKHLKSASTQLIHQPIDKIDQTHGFAAMPSMAPEGRTRAFLKIQDGCNAFCTYCIVPHARGRSRSMPVSDVTNHLKHLGSLGYREVVLTGIHLGAFGKDLTPALTLTALLERLISTCPVERLRLSSIEPTEVEDTLLCLMAADPSPLCPHLHIPLQSGDDQILKRMGRPYSHAKFSRVIQNATHILPHAAIGVDTLVGFPGESEAAFEQTYTLIESLPISYLHVFPFSPRKGTPAADYKDHVSQNIVKARCRHLRRLGEEKKMAFYRSQIGRTVNVLVETNKDAVTGHPKGFSDNYLPVVLPGQEVAVNAMVTVTITGLDDRGFLIGVKK